ncbi:MAG: hypothetical protein AAFU60_08985 [Bacteroidota bacterium]
MSEKEKTNLIVYRYRETGLEVLLVNAEKEGNEWTIPEGQALPANPDWLKDTDKWIELDPVEQEDGIFEQAYAVEADWHEIPSLKSIIKHDVRFFKNTMKQAVPNIMEKGAFFAMKEAFKKVLPHQYKQLKELKDILIDRNLTKYM